MESLGLYVYNTLLSRGQSDLTTGTCQQDTSKLRNITAHNQPIKTTFWSSVRYFQSVRFSNANPGTKNRSFEMALKISECSSAAGSWGFMGKPTTSVSLKCDKFTLTALWKHSDFSHCDPSSLFPHPIFVISCCNLSFLSYPQLATSVLFTRVL